ncbi:LCP family protein [Bacillus sp. S/N-304-OC-R1]|uniref:LCP family glycopolymer transferase n=1 Tax=Bacillus sp. S/N-304-OC-R1 TaxID=2758034 RepID=UPI001C8D90EA|nr:LCP family protein [Bacillus sp. S/N-304-OC-R1]MBY0122492.1 LCP family protein [Bacillus sp. S/N-304-OC-R1]
MKSGKKKLLLYGAGILILLVLIGTSLYGYSMYRSLTNTVETMHLPINREISEKRSEVIELSKKEPFSVLLLGVDQRPGDRGRSDSIIVLTVNPEQSSVKMLSIPRDTRTEIIGYGTVDKINHAFAFGGAEMAIATAENFLDIPIDYYVQINMEGFIKLIDSVGGITVYNDLDFYEDGKHFSKGELTLNGEDALLFSRMRYNDPRGDFGRQLRQRQIIQAFLKEGASLSSIVKYKEIFNVLGENIKTNLTFDDMVDIQKHYRSAANGVEQLSIEGSNSIINSIYYFIVSEEEKQRIQAELKKHLEL